MGIQKVTPKISVIMPVYNGEEYLAEAIESILGQTFPDFEFIIIDDGSTDSSVEIINNYQDPRIRLIENKKNQGVTYSLNKGLEEAQGEFIARMDSDDISMLYRFEKQVQFLEHNPEIDVVGSWHFPINGQGKKSGRVRRQSSNPTVLGWKILFGPPMPHPAIMSRSAFYQISGGYNKDVKFSQDYDLWYRGQSLTNYSNIQEPLLKYRSHPQKISINKLKEQNFAADHISLNAWNDLAKQPISLSDIEIIKSHRAPESLQDFLRIKQVLFLQYHQFLLQNQTTFLEKIEIRKDLAFRISNILPPPTQQFIYLQIRRTYHVQMRLLGLLELLIKWLK